MIIEDVFYVTGRGIVVTTHSDGLVQLGDTYFLNGQTVVITGIESFSRDRACPAEGVSIGLLLRTDQKREDIKPGTALIRADDLPSEVNPHEVLGQ